MSFADCRAKISDYVVDCPFSLPIFEIVCNDWLTLTFECKWRIVCHSDVRWLGCCSDIKRLVQCSDIGHGWPHMSEILRTWLDWFVRLIGQTSLVCPFRLALWKKENFSLLVLDEAYLGPDRVILNGLYVCPSQPKCLESGNDTWRESSHNYV